MVEKKRLIKALLFLVCILPKLSSEGTATLLSLTSTSTEKKIERSSLYLNANYLQYNGEITKALKSYNKLFTLEAPDYIYEGYLRLLSQANQFNEIVRLIDKTTEQFKDDLEMQLIYVQSLLNTNRDTQAKTILEGLKKKYPQDEQVMYYATTLDEKGNNIQKALDDLDGFLAKNPAKSRNSFFYFLKAKLYLKMGNIEQALASINQCLDITPRFDRGHLFKALLLEQTQKITEAIKSYKDFLDLAGDNPIIIKQLVQHLFAQRRYKEAATYLKKVKSDDPEFHFDLALLEWKANDVKESLVQAEAALAKNPSFSKAKVLVVQILLSQKRYDEAITRGTNWLMETPSDNVLIHALLSVSQQIDPNRIVEPFEKIYAKHDLLNITIALADLLFHSKQYTRATAFYEKALTKKIDKKLKTKIDYQIALNYFLQNRHDQALQKLEVTLKQNIPYPPVYNLMAFILAEANRDLERADSLINEALKLDGTSAEFLDTKGLIQHKQKNYNSAKQTFEKALKYAPGNKIIEGHLADAKQKL